MAEQLAKIEECVRDGDLEEVKKAVEKSSALVTAREPEHGVSWPHCCSLLVFMEVADGVAIAAAAAAAAAV